MPSNALLNRKHLTLAVILSLIITAEANSPAGAETLTLTTYYPAPFGSYARMRIVPGAAPAGVCALGSIYVDQTDDQIRFCETGPAWTPMLPGFVEDASGNVVLRHQATNPNLQVGIGLADPTADLHIQKAADSSVRVERVGGSQFSLVSGATDTALGTVSNTGLNITTNNTTQMRITPTGTVGLGTTTPNASTRLHVAGDLMVQGVDGAGNATDSRILFQAGGSQYTVGIDTADGNFKISLGPTVGNNISEIILNPNGDVTIRGNINLQIDPDPEGVLRLRYVNDPLAPGYYAVFAP